MSNRTISRIVCLLLASVSTGCVGLDPFGQSVPNPVFVRAVNSEVAWEKVIDTAHDYLFEIERENKLGGIIETKYKTGASLLEPWHPDSIGMMNRLESSFQSIRRKAFIRFTPAPGGYLVGVEVIKEIEDVPRALTSVGGATFLDNSAIQRDLNPVVGQETPSGWVSKGNDPALENAILRSVNRRFQ